MGLQRLKLLFRLLLLPYGLDGGELALFLELLQIDVESRRSATVSFNPVW